MSTQGDVSVASLVDDVRVACDGTRGVHADLRDATHYGRHTCGYVAFLCDECAEHSRQHVRRKASILYCRSCGEEYPDTRMGDRYADFQIGVL